MADDRPRTGRFHFDLSRANPAQRNVSDGLEVPTSWFLVGIAVSGSACITLGMAFFHISWWMGVLAVLLTFVLSIVAARATGETDMTPIGAMGKITQLTYGIIAPRNMTTNLMTAAITAGARNAFGRPADQP